MLLECMLKSNSSNPRGLTDFSSFLRVLRPFYFLRSLYVCSQLVHKTGLDSCGVLINIVEIPHTLIVVCPFTYSWSWCLDIWNIIDYSLVVFFVLSILDWKYMFNFEYILKSSPKIPKGSCSCCIVRVCPIQVHLRSVRVVVALNTFSLVVWISVWKFLSFTSLWNLLISFRTTLILHYFSNFISFVW